MSLFRARLILIYSIAGALSLVFPGAGIALAKNGGSSGGSKKGGMPGTMPTPVQPNAVEPMSPEEIATREAAEIKEQQDAERRRLYGAAGTVLTGSLGPLTETDMIVNQELQPYPRKAI